MTQKIIGIAGAARAGKDTVADFLVKDHGFVRVALADPMKRMIYSENLWPYTRDQLWGPSERRGEPPPGMKGPILRKPLQRLGTEWGREEDEDVWVRKALRMIDLLLRPGGLAYDPARGLVIEHEPAPTPAGVVIPDVRFENEAAAIQAVGGEVWKITRPGTDGALLPGGVAGHASEAGITSYDRALQNVGTLEDLRSLVAGALKNSGLDMLWERPVP